MKVKGRHTSKHQGLLLLPDRASVDSQPQRGVAEGISHNASDQPAVGGRFFHPCTAAVFAALCCSMCAISQAAGENGGMGLCKSQRHTTAAPEGGKAFCIELHVIGHSMGPTGDLPGTCQESCPVPGFKVGQQCFQAFL